LEKLSLISLTVAVFYFICFAQIAASSNLSNKGYHHGCVVIVSELLFILLVLQQISKLNSELSHAVTCVTPI
jgi:hypothetical protein